MVRNAQLRIVEEVESLIGGETQADNFREKLPISKFLRNPGLIRSSTSSRSIPAHIQIRAKRSLLNNFSNQKFRRDEEWQNVFAFCKPRNRSGKRITIELLKSISLNHQSLYSTNMRERIDTTFLRTKFYLRTPPLFHWYLVASIPRARHLQRSPKVRCKIL